jgi:hypothetical protein
MRQEARTAESQYEVCTPAPVTAILSNSINLSRLGQAALPGEGAGGTTGGRRAPANVTVTRA